jgi:spore cortex biosynthesis protein YabQ
VLEFELKTLAWTFGCGVGLSLVFDIWRACRAVLRPGWVFTAIGDLGFWTLAALATAFVLMRTNYGQVRFYIFLSLASGFLLHQLTLSPPLARPLRQLFRKGLRFFLRLALILGLPVWVPLCLSARLGAAGFSGGRRLCRAVVRMGRRKLQLLAHWQKNRKR